MKLFISTLAVTGALSICTAHAAAQEIRTPSNTHILVQAYNVIYKNNFQRITKESASFLRSNPGLIALALNPFFVCKIASKLRNNASLNQFLELFDAYDQSGRIKKLAFKLAATCKDEIEAGNAAVQKLIDEGYTVTVLTGQSPEVVELLKKRFPILELAHDMPVDFKSSSEAFAELKTKSGKEHVVLLTGNMKHKSVVNAEQAGVVAHHFTQTIN